MQIPEEFDPIRPYEPEELPEVYERLLDNPQFRAVVGSVMPDVPFEAVAQTMRSCRTNLEFQKAFSYTIIKKLMSKASRGFDIDASAIDDTCQYTFMSNHRDIVMDSALLNVLLVDAGFPSTCEIAIGDNLLSLPWVKDLVRINKSFIVERGLPPRQMFLASRRLSGYMHFAIEKKRESIWIAQREGRAKDSDDRTQPAIFKMMTMEGEGSAIERLRQLHIVPLAISYEYDPCDFLKAREFQLRRDVEEWQKAPQDDIISMQTGIMGYKGRVHYHCAECIDEWLLSVDSRLSGFDLYGAVAAHIDQQIHRNYCIYPANIIAADMLGDNLQGGTYTAKERAAFEGYLNGQLAKIDLPQKDEPFLRERMLTMYANPYRNYLKAKS